MRSGEGLRERPRHAGQWTQWGEVVVVEPAGVLAPFELVRCSVGRPVPWSFGFYLEGAIGGDTVFCSFRPGLGSTAPRSLLKATLTAGNTFEVSPGIGVPAVELILSVEVRVAAVGRLRITAQAAPVVWAAVDPSTMESWPR